MHFKYKYNTQDVTPQTSSLALLGLAVLLLILGPSLLTARQNPNHHSMQSESNQPVTVSIAMIKQHNLHHISSLLLQQVRAERDLFEPHVATQNHMYNSQYCP